MRKLNQNGFTGFEGVLLLLVIAALGFAGFTVYQRNNDGVATNQTVVTKNADSKDSIQQSSQSESVVAGQVDFNVNGERGPSSAGILFIDGLINPAGELSEVWAEYGKSFSKLDKQTEHITRGVGLGDAGSYSNFTFTIQTSTLDPGTNYFYRIAAKTADGKVTYSGIAAFTSRK